MRIRWMGSYIVALNSLFQWKACHLILLIRRRGLTHTFSVFFHCERARSWFTLLASNNLSWNQTAFGSWAGSYLGEGTAFDKQMCARRIRALGYAAIRWRDKSARVLAEGSSSAQVLHLPYSYQVYHPAKEFHSYTPNAHWGWEHLGLLLLITFITFMICRRHGMARSK